ISYYYDSHPTEEDLMGETTLHHLLIQYLEEILRWLFHHETCSIQANLNFYTTDDEGEYPIVPDVAVIKGVPFTDEISWRIGVTGPVPQVVFEVASEKTWKRDLDEKPHEYAQNGVKEYYAFDPFLQPLPLSQRRRQRLFGWHLDADSGLMRQLHPQPDGSLWSPQLMSKLRPEDNYLRFYDPFGNRRLTEKEVETLARRAETARAEREAQRAEAAMRRMEAEVERAEAAMRRMEAEAERAEQERLRAEALAERLRALGIDPGQL
ncbi:MAG TPA: Uma2 family endonuclease, partial [Ktedonobacteraceae bacterium]|nr:Uma2 family endonuclease [Ktedonobacteraceae bacterium]